MITSPLRDEIVTTYRRLAAANLLPLSSGNISARHGDNILITPTGANADLHADDLVLIGFNGRATGPGIPSSEWAMHAEIYLQRPDAKAVVHTHGDACTALSCHRRPLPPFHYMIASFGGSDVPCTPYAPFGSRELAQHAGHALKERSACLLANHGMICRGATVEAAANTALKLEMLARQYILTTQIGPPIMLTTDELAEVSRRYQYYGATYIPESEHKP